MTPYRDRREAGEYDATQSADVQEQQQEQTQTEQTDAENDVTLNELREQAKALGVPYYGSKADISERIAAAQTAAGEGTDASEQ